MNFFPTSKCSHFLCPCVSLSNMCRHFLCSCVSLSNMRRHFLCPCVSLSDTCLDSFCVRLSPYQKNCRHFLCPCVSLSKIMQTISVCLYLLIKNIVDTFKFPFDNLYINVRDRLQRNRQIQWHSQFYGFHSSVARKPEGQA